MKPKRPSSALQKTNQSTRLSQEKQITDNFHQGLLSLGKPIVLPRPQTAKLFQINNSKTNNPCISENKCFLSEKDINLKLQECLTSDVEI